MVLPVVHPATLLQASLPRWHFPSHFQGPSPPSQGKGLIRRRKEIETETSFLNSNLTYIKQYYCLVLLALVSSGSTVRATENDYLHRVDSLTLLNSLFLTRLVCV